MKRIIFISRETRSAFRGLDVKILSESYAVSRFDFTYTPVSLVRLFFRIRKYDLAFCWFAGLWSFFAVLFANIWKTKSLIVAGGFDVANVPEINYGLPRSKILKYFARYALNNADCVLSVSETNRAELLAFAKPKRNRLIYNCVLFPRVAEKLAKKKQVLTVGAVSKSSSVRKGHFNFVNVAKYLPGIRFILVGKQKDNTINLLRKEASDNVEFRGYVEPDLLLSLYHETKVYLQLSYHEAFGLSVVESMWHGCTPVVSGRGALPEIVGDCGVVLSEMNAKLVADKIREVMDDFPDVNYEAIKRAKTFSFQSRKAELLEEVDSLLSYNE